MHGSFSARDQREGYAEKGSRLQLGIHDETQFLEFPHLGLVWVHYRATYEYICHNSRYIDNLPGMRYAISWGAMETSRLWAFRLINVNSFRISQAMSSVWLSSASLWFMDYRFSTSSRKLSTSGRL